MVMILNLPSPPRMDVNRDYSGSYGTAHVTNRKDYGHSADILFPVFMPYLASKIKREGYKLKALDAQATRLNSDGTIREIKNKQPKFIISMLSLPSLYGDIHLLNKIKEKFPEIFLIGVGAVCKVLSEEILRKSKIDFLVNAEYPFYSNPIIKLIDALDKKSTSSVGKISGLIYREKQEKKLSVKNRPLQGPQMDETLDDLDIKIYSEFPIEKYKLRFFGPYGKHLNYFPILSAKGCPFPCIYCPYPIGFGKEIFYKSPVNLVNEIEFLYESFGIKAFVFRDQVFTANEERVKEICDLISERNLKVNWLCETRADKVSKNLLKKMKKAGCNRIHYGVETGDENVLRKVGKPVANKEVIKEAFKITREEGIYTSAHVIIGLPGETKETLMNTYNFLLEINPDGVTWNLITSYPGTKLFNIAKQKKLILTYDWEKYNTEDVVMRTEEISGEELEKIKKTFRSNFRIRQLFRRMLKGLYSKKDFVFLARRIIHEFVLKTRLCHGDSSS